MKFNDAQQEKRNIVVSGKKAYHFEGIWGDGSRQSFIFKTLKEAKKTKRNMTNKPTMWNEIK